MANRFFLNALREDASLPTPDTGRWKDDSQDRLFLIKYASDIYVEGQLSHAQVAHSVPSVFARPLLFHQALSDSRNPLHDALVSEWRGLLALFALKTWYGFNLSSIPYDVPPEEPGESSQVGSAGIADRNLRTILRQQLPKPATDWNRWWLIYCAGELIGATSPWTMVYTPAQYRAHKSIPWTNDKGILCDPIRTFDPNKKVHPIELALLLRWVELVQKNQKWDMPEHLEEKANLVAAQLEAWREELAQHAQPDITLRQLSDQAPIREAPFNRFLLFPREGDTPEATSDLLLESKRLGERKVLVFSDSASKSDRVWGPVFVGHVDMNSLARPVGEGFTSRGGKKQDIPYVFAEEAFFPPKLIEMPLQSALQRGSSQLSLPLTPKFLEYFDYQDLADVRETLTVAELERSVMVTLRLPLRGGKQLIVEKTYNRATDVLKLESGTPSFAVWPDFFAEDWKENFAAYAGLEAATEREDFRVAPLLTGGQILPESLNDGSQKAVRIWHCLTPPIGFALRYRNPGSKKILEVGILLRDRLQRPPSIVDTKFWDVAVDFGTSNTTVMVRKDGGDSELLPISGRLKFLTKAQSDREDAINNNLYPREGATPPFRTLLYQTEATLISGDSPGYTLRFVFDPTETRSKPVSNVKWGIEGGKREEEPLRQYLKGLVRYIVCEARAQGVGKVQFRWSRPLSLPDSVYSAMSNFWTNVAAGYPEVTVGEQPSESDAVCRCLASLLKIRAESLTIAVDVGGGSTDVGFWSARDLLDQFSFKLAGNDILHPRWVEMPEYLATLYRAATRGAEMPEGERGNVRDRAAIYVNQLFYQAKDETGKLFTGQNPRLHPVSRAIFDGSPAEPPWLYLRTMAYVFFTGLCYYLGLYTRRLIAVAPFPEITVYFGGRGSATLAWLSRDEMKMIEILNDAFLQGLWRDNPVKKQLSVEFLGPALRYGSELPPLKHEVARGMLSAPLGGTVSKNTSVLIGEVGWTSADGTACEWDKAVTVQDLSGLRPPADYENSYISEFLNIVLRRHEEINVDVSNLSKVRLSRSAIQDCVKRSAEVSAQILQPVFACELKTIMDQYLELALSSGVASEQRG